MQLFFNRIKRRKRIAARDDGLAANFTVFIELAALRSWLGAYEATP